MSNHRAAMLPLCVGLLLAALSGQVDALAWNGDWASGCDFEGNDMGNAATTVDQCGPRCVNTAGCSHFVWTQFNGGTCFLKKGAVTKANAFETADKSMVCGVVPNWNGNDWAPACDFKGRDLRQARVPPDQCGPTCTRTNGCSHFTWTTFNGGTCFMKTGAVSKLDAFTTGDPSMVCGIVQSSPPPAGRTLLGVCYDAMHNAEYPLNGSPLGNLAAAIDADFKHMSENGIKYARTYYSNFYGFPVAPAAAKYGIKLHLGVFMTDEAWYQGQVESAAEAVRLYPDTVEAILVGNENLRPNGPYTADAIINKMIGIRDAVQAKAGRSVPVGTVQRINEWLDAADALRLGQSADVIGVNIYTFFGPYNSNDPPNTSSFTDQWGKMVSRYGAAKLRLTETGFPSAGGASPTGVPANIANAKGYYNGVVSWLNTGATKGLPIFYFAMYDRRPDDNSMGTSYEKAFGLFTWERRNKGII